MSNSSENMFEKYKDDDFSQALPVYSIPALARLQAEAGKKTRITMRVDSAVLAIFKARAEITGGELPNDDE